MQVQVVILQPLHPQVLMGFLSTMNLLSSQHFRSHQTGLMEGRPPKRALDTLGELQQHLGTLRVARTVVPRHQGEVWDLRDTKEAAILVILPVQAGRERLPVQRASR